MGKRPFLKHQLAAWRTQVKRRKTLPLFWEMRLGKTLITIRWLATRPGMEKALIVCPIDPIRSWTRELELEGHSSCVLLGTKKQRMKAYESAPDGCRFFLINYEGLRDPSRTNKRGQKIAVPSEFALMDWDAVIADESTIIKSPRSQVTKIFLKEMADAEYKAILSGLPNPEGPEDFVTQMIFVNGSFMGCKDFWSWRVKYMVEVGTGGWMVPLKKRKLIKEEVDQFALVLSREEAGIGSRKMRETLHAEIPAACRKAIGGALKDLELDDRMTNNILVVLTWISQICGGRFDDPSLQHDAKLKLLKKTLFGDLKGQKVVIWATATIELLAIESYLKDAGLTCAVARGQQDNGPAIAAFQEGRLDAIICQPKCIKMGIDLSRASALIYYSNYFSYGVRAQSEDRGIHPLKKEPLLILDIVAKDTPDEDMPEVLMEKRIDSNSFLRQLFKRTKERVAA